MNNSTSHNSIKENVLSAIHTGKVSMKPRWHFLLRALLLILGVILASLALVYVVSFAIFVLRQNGAFFAPQFGVRGIGELLLSLPLLFVLLAVLFIIILEIFVRRYQFGYRKPLVYSVLIIALLVVLGGIIVDKTRLHQSFLRQAFNDKLPLGGQLYRTFGEPRAYNTVIGLVRERTTSGFNLETHHRQIYMVVVTSDTQVAQGTEIEPNSWVVVFGPRTNLIISAEAVAQLPEPPLWVEREQHMMLPPSSFSPPL